MPLLSRMMAQHYSEKNQVYNENLFDDEMCEAIYFIIHSISTQYVNLDDDKQCTNRETTKTNDVTLEIKNMEIKELSDHKMKDEKNIQEKSTKQIDNVMIQQNTPPTHSRWQKTFKMAQEIFKPGTTDELTHTNIAIQFPETHTNVTYVELLRKIAESNIDLQLKEIDGAIHVNTRNQILLVPIDHFHSYLRQENDIYCIVCHMTLPERDADIHKYEIGHMNHVVKVIDHRGFRKVNYSYNHCVICNLRVNKKKEVKAHLKTNRHIETRKLLVKTNAKHVVAKK